jgi:hypothetical protein
MPKTHISVSGINHPQNVRFIVGLPTWLFFLHIFLHCNNGALYFQWFGLWEHLREV